MVMMMNRESDIVHQRQQCPNGQSAKPKIFGWRAKKKKKLHQDKAASSTTIHLDHCYYDHHHHHTYHHCSYHTQKFATSGSCSYYYYYYNNNNTWPSILDIGWPLLLLLLVALLLLTPIRGAISPHCRCIIFDDTFGKEFGVFTSPDWPKPYEDNIECLLYKFIAQDDHIVEINFDEFDVQRVMPQQPPSSSSSSSSTSLDSNQNFGCDQGDYVKLFLHLKTDWINEQTEWNQPLLCGKFPDIEQTHFSSGPVLMFEFHSDWRTGNSTGFRGTFRFLKKAMFRIDGQLLDGTQCDYRFQHESSIGIGSNSKQNSRRILQSFQPDLDSDGDDHDNDHDRGDGHVPQRNFEKLLLLKSDKSKPGEGAGRATAKPEGYWVGQRGYFFSPQYPSTYPKPVKCSYHFLTADPNQRVRLLFVDVSLRHDDQSCISNADVIHVYDGGDTDSDLIYQICGHTSFLEILSSTNQLLVEFISPENQTNYLNRLQQQQQQQTSASSSAIWQQSWKQHRSPRPSGKGFKAEYSFLSVTSLIHPNALPFSPFTPTISQYWPPYSANHTGSGNRPGTSGVSTITTTNAATNTTTITATTSSTMATIATCDHWFSSELHPNGTFQSINYPEPYPANIRCNYHFVGHGKQRVQVIFLDFDVYKVEDQHRGCEISDSLTAYVVTNGQKEYIDDFCGQELPPRIMSNGHRLTLEFKSLDHDHEPYRRFYKKINYPHQQQAAAAASYLQHSNHQLDQIQVDLDMVGGYQNLTSTSLDVQDDDVPVVGEQQQQLKVHVHGHKRKKKNNLAEHRNKLKKKKQQQHNNRNNRKRRKKKLETSLHNIGGGGQNVDDHDANDGDDDNDDDHHQEDRTDEEFDDEDDDEEEDDNNDGRGTATIHHGHHHHHHNNNHYHQHQHRNPKAKNLLQQQQQQPGAGARNKPGKVIVKNQTTGTALVGGPSAANVDALGRPYNRYRSRGFKAAFRFVTNFGIETGRQDSKSVCGFVYNSSESKQGYFTSPNYPGLYPKDTECHYFFYGNHTEKVRIEFVHFDVEGVTPCTLETASDYVEFSNVYSADRQVYRHCGLKHPKVVESEGDFFRITFKSNGRFDGTGFNATYRFVYSPYTPKHHSKADDDDDDVDDEDADTDGGQQQSSKTLIKTGKSVKTGRKHNRNSSPSAIMFKHFGSVAILWTLTLSTLMLWWLWADL